MIRDPVHGYVEVPDELDALVRCAAVQRLRNIGQNARAVAGFPSMTGTRYEHALGTMHLALAAWRSCWQNTVAPEGADRVATQDDFKRAVLAGVSASPTADACSAAWIAGDAQESMLWSDFERRIGLVVGAVGLLHDVGHPPFSHVLEPFYTSRVTEIFGAQAQDEFDAYRQASAEPVQFHEWAGLRIFDSIPDGVFAALPRSLIRLVLADRTGRGWAHSLHSIVDGQFDVDRLDYLMRDAYTAGTEYGSIDSARLVQSLELHRVGPDNWIVGLGARAVSSFETLVIQRAQHYRWVVHHYAVVAACTALERCASQLYELSRTSDGVEGMTLFDTLPNLDYIAIGRGEGGAKGEPCADDHDCFAWLRGARPALEVLARPEQSSEPSRDGTDMRRMARSTLALLDTFDTFSISPITAWRNYQEYLARADQNPEAVRRLLAAAVPATPPAYLRSQASRQAVDVLATELPARLNSGLGAVLSRWGDDHDLSAAERLLTDQVPVVPECGEGCWLVTTMPFLALHDDFAGIWRGDEQALLSDVSPYPLALAAIDLMRPRFHIFFVPFEGPRREATTRQRREVGRAFLETVAGWA